MTTRANATKPFICTKDTPWKSDITGMVRHQDAYEVGGQIDGYPGGDIIKMKCPNCGHTWHKELPQ